MKSWLVIVIGMLCCTGAARAQNFDGTPLASCPGYVANNPVVSDIGWSVGCFLHAIESKDKPLALAIAPGARCLEEDPQACIDNIMDEVAVDQFYGGISPGRSFYDLLVAAKTVVISYFVEENTVDVIFAVAPEKGKVDFAGAWGKDFFDCSFKFDKERIIWIVDGICRIDVDEMEPLPIDLSGASSDLPPMLWKPKKK